MYRPLLMMRTRGLSGPFASNHAGIGGKSTSAGNFIGSSSRNLVDDPEFDTPDDDIPWITTGWTIANGVATCGGAAGATLSQDL